METIYAAVERADDPFWKKISGQLLLEIQSE